MGRHRTTRPAVALAVVALVVAAVMLSGCGSTIKNFVGNRGEIGVTVKDANTGLPLEGAKVTCGDTKETTGVDGTVMLKNLKISSQEITVSKGGYASQTKTVKLELTSPVQDVTFKLKPNA